MIYSARTPKWTVTFIFVIFIVRLLLPNTFGHSIQLNFFDIILLSLLIISLVLKFVTKIEHDVIIYRVLLLKIPIYKRVISSEDLVEMKFKRIGWSSKLAILRVRNGLNIRLAHFKQEVIYNHLQQFAELHHIEVHKSKDYLILERMQSA